MRIRNVVAFSIVLFLLYGVIKHPQVVLYPFSVLVSAVLYILVCLYAYTVQPMQDAYYRFKSHKEYHLLIERNYHERSLLLQDVIKAQAELMRCKQMHALGIVYEQRQPLNYCGTAQIIYKQLQQKDSFFIIDKGSSDGIALNMLATLNNVLLGRVVSVYPWHARVMPITDQQCHVPVVCAQSGAHGVFHGNQIDFISHLEPLVLDELILTSGDGLLYPQGLAVGRIKNFTLNNLGYLYEVVVDPLYDLNNLSYCSLISKNTQDAVGPT